MTQGEQALFNRLMREAALREVMAQRADAAMRAQFARDLGCRPVGLPLWGATGANRKVIS
jgi:hypothetical protein